LLVGWFSLLGAVIHTTLYYSRSNAASINTLAPVSSLSLLFLGGCEEEEGRIRLEREKDDVKMCCVVAAVVVVVLFLRCLPCIYVCVVILQVIPS
jgi:Kef-type K+ transport system membrane component KefB